MSGSVPVAPSELGHRPEPSSPLSLVPCSKASHHLLLCVTQRRTREGGRRSERPPGPRGPCSTESTLSPISASPPAAAPPLLVVRLPVSWEPRDQGGTVCNLRRPDGPGGRGWGIYTHRAGNGFHIPADTALLPTPPCPLGLLHQGPLSDALPSIPPGWTKCVRACVCVCARVCAQRSLGTPDRRAS